MIRKAFYLLAIIATFFIASCDEEKLNTSGCTTTATVRDLTGLDGCGFVFELEDGTRLEPIRMFFCGTPPLPKEVTENPLYKFEFVDGKKVAIDYEVCTDCMSVCMVGSIVTITCLTELDNSTDD